MKVFSHYGGWHALVAFNDYYRIFQAKEHLNISRSHKHFQPSWCSCYSLTNDLNRLLFTISPG